MNKPVNISYEELVKTIKMFWIDNTLEEAIDLEIESMVTELETKLTKIGTKEGLRDYICSDKAALGNILGLMEISEEKENIFFRRSGHLIKLEMFYWIRRTLWMMCVNYC